MYRLVMLVRFRWKWVQNLLRIVDSAKRGVTVQEVQTFFHAHPGPSVPFKECPLSQTARRAEQACIVTGRTSRCASLGHFPGRLA